MNDKQIEVFLEKIEGKDIKELTAEELLTALEICAGFYERLEEKEKQSQEAKENEHSG